MPKMGTTATPQAKAVRATISRTRARTPRKKTLAPALRTSTPAPRSSTNASPKPGLAAALFSNTQQKVLGLLFGQPDRSFFANEIIALAGAGSGAVQRELARLEAAALVTTSRVGNQKHFQAAHASPIYAELVGIISKTVGIAEPLRQALKPFARKIRTAFVYGSIAKGGDTAASDIDIMIIGEKITYADLYTTLEVTESRLGRKINPTIYNPTEFAKKRTGGNFVSRVLAQPKIFIIGNEAGLDSGVALG